MISGDSYGPISDAAAFQAAGTVAFVTVKVGLSNSTYLAALAAFAPKDASINASC